MKANRGILGLISLFILQSSLCLPAWSLDLSTHDNQNAMTPVSQLNTSGSTGTYAHEPMVLDGNIGVDDLKKLSHKKTIKVSQKPLPAPEKPHVPVIAPMKPLQEVPSQPAPRPIQDIQAAPAIAVFPVVVHSTHDKAFSDVPVLLSSAIANKLKERLGQGYIVLNPIYTYDTLEAKGLAGIFQGLIKDYLNAGEPNEKDLQYLADQLSDKHRQVKWIAFVQADFDINNIAKPFGLASLSLYHMAEIIPKDPSYFLNGNLKIFSTDDGIPLVYDKSGTALIKMRSFGSYTRTVYENSDSTYHFKSVAAKMASDFVKKVTLNDNFPEASVRGDIVTSDTPTNMTPDDQAALQHVLEHNPGGQ